MRKQCFDALVWCYPALARLREANWGGGRVKKEMDSCDSAVAEELSRRTFDCSLDSVAVAEGIEAGASSEPGSSAAGAALVLALSVQRQQ